MSARTEPSSFPGGAAVTAEEAHLPVVVWGDPTDGQVPGWSTERNRFEWVDAGGGSGTSLAWEAVTVPHAQAAFDTDNATGTWVFNPDGSISQTNNDGVNDYSIFTLTDFDALAWALQFDLTIDDTVEGVFEAGMFADYPAVSASGVAGSGLYMATDGALPNLAPAPVKYSVGTTGFDDVSHALDATHTYRFFTLGAQSVLSVDGVVVEVADSKTLNGVRPGARIALYNSGAATFDNLKAWRIPLPTLV